MNNNDYINDMNFILGVFQDSVEQIANQYNNDVKTVLLQCPTTRNFTTVDQTSTLGKILDQVFKRTQRFSQLDFQLIIDTLYVVIDQLSEALENNQSNINRRANYARQRPRGTNRNNAVFDPNTLEPTDRQQNHQQTRSDFFDISSNNQIINQTNTQPMIQRSAQQQTNRVTEFSKANQPKKDWSNYDVNKNLTLKLTNDYALTEETKNSLIGKVEFIKNSTGTNDNKNVTFVLKISNNESFEDELLHGKQLNDKLNMINSLKRDNYICIEDTFRLTVLDIPTEVSKSVVNDICEMFASFKSNENGNTIALKYLNEIQKIIFKYTEYYDTIDCFIGELIQTRVLNRYGRLSSNIFKKMNVFGLSDFIKVINTEPKFVNDPENNKTILSALAVFTIPMLKRIFTEETLVVTMDNYPGDIIKISSLSFSEQNISKYDLMLTDQNKELIETVLSDFTILRIPHRNMLSNLLTSNDLLNLFELTQTGLVLDHTKGMEDERVELLMRKQDDAISIDSVVFEFKNKSSNSSKFRCFDAILPIDLVTMHSDTLTLTTYIEN